MKIKIPALIAPTMRDKYIHISIILSPIIFMLLQLFHIMNWHCPFHSITGKDCPGCGITRGVKEALKGNINSSLHYHPFSFILISIWLLYIIVYFLPENKKKRIIEKIEFLETKRAITAIIFITYIIYGLTRLILEISGYIKPL